MAYASIQAMLNRLTPAIVSNTEAGKACNKAITEIPDRAVDAMLPKLTMTIHSIRDNLSVTMASTMMSASMFFGAKVDKAIILMNKHATGTATQTTSTIADLLDLCLLPITTALGSLEAKVAALNATATTKPPKATNNICGELTPASPPWVTLVIDMRSPPPQVASASTAPTGSKLFLNVDASV